MLAPRDLVHGDVGHTAPSNRPATVAKHEYDVPSYVTIYNFLMTLDLEDFGKKLSELI